METKKAILFLLLCALPSAIWAQENPWVAMTRVDLQGIHDILRDNHPGPVDPENPRYAKWLEEGLEKANQRARGATSFSDYVRALEFYTNGFQDGHIGIGLNLQTEDQKWPGFIVDGTSGGYAQVVYAETDAGVTKGARLLSCDGRSLEDLMTEHTDPFFWNSAIPHQRYMHVYRLFYQDAIDPQPRFKSCKFSTGDVSLKWRTIDFKELQKILDNARESGNRQLQMRFMNGVWLLSIPTLAYNTDAEVARIRAFINEIKQKAPELHRSTVIFDVRGNHGGDSAWGEELASAFYGKEWVTRIRSQFDQTVEWRASPSNLDFINSMIKREEKAGLKEAISYLVAVREAMEEAMKKEKPLARIDKPPQRLAGPPPSRPVTERIYFFTDGICASACLDFADLMRRLPNVVHVGLPTSADAVYIDNTYQDLPSRLAGLGYSMKVYRNRVRKNNEWYEPQIRWPGGKMTDESITRWVASLHLTR